MLAQHYIKEELHDQDLFIVADLNKMVQPHRIVERAAIVGSGDGDTTVALTSGQTVLTTTTKSNVDQKTKNNVIIIVALSAGAVLATAGLVGTVSAFIAFVRRRRMRIRPREEEQPRAGDNSSNKSTTKRNTSKSSSRNSSSSSKSQKSTKPSSSSSKKSTGRKPISPSQQQSTFQNLPKTPQKTKYVNEKPNDKTKPLLQSQTQTKNQSQSRNLQINNTMTEVDV